MRNLLQIGNVDQEFSLLVKETDNLKAKIIQRSIFFESDLFSSTGFLHDSRCTLVPGHDVMASGIRHQQKLKIFVEQF